MNLKTRIKLNRGVDHRDPNFDEELGEMSQDDIDDALEYEAECRLEEMENDDRWDEVD